MATVRNYSNYDEYIKHQSAKLEKIYPTLTCEGYREGTIAIYMSLFKLAIKYGLDRKVGGKLLCLGARLGEEVEAWQRLGFDAEGIDLNPGPNNKFVKKGDFHNLEFKDKTFDCVFSNSIDHVLYVNQFNKECHRVLKMGGKALLEVRPHKIESVLDGVKKDGPNAGNPWYESFYWESQEELIDFFVRSWLWKKVKYYDFRLYNPQVNEYSNPRPFLILTK